MSSRLRAYLRQHHVGLLALFLALTGGTAYALDGTNTVNSGDIKNDQVKSIDVRDDTLAAGGLQAIDLGPDSVGTSEVADGSLTGADVDESKLSQVPSALNADTLDGKNADELASARIHVVGNTDGTQYVDLLPGLRYQSYCSPHDILFYFLTGSDFDAPDYGINGTANAMMGGKGIESPSANTATMNLDNGFNVTGFPFNNGNIPISLSNDDRAAQGEIQLVIDTASKTYSAALHMYHRSNGPNSPDWNTYCEVYGTVTVAE